jgi:uncharacterized glyoxalase superfamily protein PhnB
MSAIPEGFATITPSLSINGAAAALELYAKAFGAKEVSRMSCPETGKIMHACMQIGSSKIFVADTMPGMGCGDPSRSSFYLYMPDVDKAVRQAKEAGLKEIMPAEDMFWGDRVGGVQDRFGINWTLATHVRDVSEADMEEGRKKFMAKAKAKAA